MMQEHQEPEIRVMSTSRDFPHHSELSNRSQSESTAAAVAAAAAANKKSAIRRIYRNLIVFSISSMLFNSSQKGIDTLQTSLNTSNNLGIYFHLVYSGVSAIFCFFLPIVSIKLLGYKWTIVVFQFMSTSYILANQFRHVYTLLPAAALHGIASVVLYALHGSLIASLAKDYLSYTKKHRGQTFIKFFAIYGTFFHVSHLMGSAVSAIVLNVNIFGGSNEHHANATIETNQTHSLPDVEIKRICGASGCPSHASSIHGPPRQEMLHMTIIYSVLSGSGILIIVFLLDNLKPNSDEIDTIKSALKENLKIFKNIHMLLFIPIYLFIGSLGTFLSFDLSVNYLSCGYGINILGVFFFTTGLSSLIFSALITQVSKIVNKTLMISLILVAMIAILSYLFFWSAGTSVYIMYSIAVFLGLSEATWGTFLHGIIGITFYDRQTVAYSTFRFVLSVVSLASYGFSLFVCTYIKIFVLIALAIVSLCCIIGLEIVFRCSRHQKSLNEYKMSPSQVGIEYTHAKPQLSVHFSSDETKI